MSEGSSCHDSSSTCSGERVALHSASDLFTDDIVREKRDARALIVWAVNPRTTVNMCT
jgi:hypothetical protein